MIECFPSAQAGKSPHKRGAVFLSVGFFRYHQGADDLFKKDWPIYTRTTDACPTQYYPTVNVKNSLISNGCIIKGTVENSVIGRGAVIEEGAVVKNCVISAYDKIGKGAVLENQVVDKYATIQDGTKVVAPETTPGYIKYRDRL